MIANTDGDVEGEGNADPWQPQEGEAAPVATTPKRPIVTTPQSPRSVLPAAPLNRVAPAAKANAQTIGRERRPQSTGAASNQHPNSTARPRYGTLRQRAA